MFVNNTVNIWHLTLFYTYFTSFYTYFYILLYINITCFFLHYNTLTAFHIHVYLFVRLLLCNLLFF